MDSSSYEKLVRENQELKKALEIYRGHRAVGSAIYMHQLEEPAFVIDNHHFIVDANQSFLDFNRLNPRQLIGNKIGGLPCRTFFDRQIAEHIEQALQGQIRKATGHYQQANGKDIYVEHHYHPYFDDEGKQQGIICIIANVSELSERENEFYENHRKLQTLLKNLPGMAYRCSNERGWPMAFISEGCTELTGYKPEEIVQGKVMYEDLIYPQDRQHVWQSVQEALERNNPFRITYRIKTRQGEQKWIWEQGRMVPSPEPGETHLEGLMTDITERKKAEEILNRKNDKLKATEEELRASNEELREANQRLEEQKVELRKAKKKAEESDRLKSTFLANMSHEIRTPMNGIMGFASMLQKKPYDPEEQTKFLKIIHDSSSHLLEIINDIVDVSKIEANQLSLKPSPFCLNDTLQELYNTYLAELDQKNKTHIALYLEQGLSRDHSWINADVNRLKQILYNLLGNAVKFTEKGSIRFGYKQEAPACLLFYVADTGIGIPADKVEQIFSRFEQAKESNHSEYGGSGLGLTITRSLVEMMGGKIWVESQPEHGTTFYFTLPFKTRSA
ncbi:MAG: PAS domain S-box protein [Bacteroidales bacterium]|nr:PAS domain S-box protein [Bacteroidales bacterium]